jgi:dTDP-glucose pyrophosphorylase
MSGGVLDKAVVMARGLGKRMQQPVGGAALDRDQAAAADAGIKAMIPIGRPFLDYVLSALADAGVRRVCLVIGPEHAAIREYYGQQVSLERLRIDFAVQEVADGTAHAVAAAEAFADADDFLVLNADNYYPVEAIRPLVALSPENRHPSGASPIPGSRIPGNSVFAVALFERQALLERSNIPADRIARYAIAGRTEAGTLAEIVEKPDPATLARFPEPWLVSMNLWRFGPAIIEACRAIGPSPRDEFELVDAVRYAMTQLDVQFHAVCVQAPVLDLTCRDDIAPVAARLEGIKVQL